MGKQTFYKRGKQALPLFLACIVLISSLSFLSGCGKEAEKGSKKKKEETAMGRFVENEIALPEGVDYVSAAGRMEDGTLLLIGHGENSENPEYYLSEGTGDTLAWKQQSLPEQLDSKHCSYIYQSAVAPDGTLFVCGSFEADQFENWIFTRDGEAKKLAIALEDGSNNDNFIIEAHFAPDGSLYVMDLGRIVYQVEIPSGDVKKKYKNDDGRAVFGVAGKYLMLIGDKKTSVYDAETGEGLPEDKTLSEQMNKLHLGANGTDSPIILFTGNGEGIFYGNHDGIYYHVPGGSVTEQVVDGKLNTMGDPTTVLRDLWYADEDRFLFLCRDVSGKSRLYQYTYSDTTPAVPENELKVYSLEDSSTLRQAISLFQKEHPDTYVNLEIGRSEGDAVTVNDALRTLNTNIMAGDGPDVMVLDGMPVESYIEKGLLMDLMDVKKDLDKESGLFDNISKVYEKDGKLYGLPARFLFYYIQGEKESVKKMDTLENLQKEVERLKAADGKKGVMIRLDKSLLISILFDCESANMKKEDGTMDEQRLRTLYETAKIIYDAQDKSEDRQDYNLNFEGAQETIGTVSMLDYLMKGVTLNLGTITGESDILLVTSAERQLREKGQDVEYDIFNGGLTKSFLPSLSLGVNRKTENADAAKEFIKTAIGPEAGAAWGSGLPVNKKAYEKMKDSMSNENSVSSFSVADSGSQSADDVFTFETQTPRQEDFDKLEQMIASLDSASWDDAVIKEMVADQGEKYLEGSQSVEDTVKNVMQKIKLYLSE